MRLGPVSFLASALLIVSVVPASATPRVRRGPTSPHTAKEKPAAKPKSAPISISPERATQIQTALVKAGYMTSAPSGVWDAPTQAAMEKMQSDNGWQTKLVPDSRAIIKLGLGSSVSAGNLVTEAPGTNGSNQ